MFWCNVGVRCDNIDAQLDSKCQVANALTKMNVFGIHARMVDDVKIIIHRKSMNVFVRWDLPDYTVNWNCLRPEC